MTRAQILDRLAEGTPLRLGELARAAGYSREYLRKLCEAGALAAQRTGRSRGHRRIPVEEAERFLRAEGALETQQTQETQLLEIAS